jgi:hypothetical protein
MSICEKSSEGLFSAGVPDSNTQKALRAAKEATACRFTIQQYRDKRTRAFFQYLGPFCVDVLAVMAFVNDY